MKPIEIKELNEAELKELNDLYQKTKEARLRTRVQMILLAAEQKMSAPQIGQIVRKDDETVRRWLKR